MTGLRLLVIAAMLCVFGSVTMAEKTDSKDDKDTTVKSHEQQISELKAKQRKEMEKLDEERRKKYEEEQKKREKWKKKQEEGK